MARELSASMLTEIQAGTLRPVVFLEGLFDSGGSPSADYLRLWTGAGTISWNSLSWYGAGSLISISPIRETSDAFAAGFSVSLSGQPSANISRALQACRSGASGKLWLGALDSAGAVIADPYQCAVGRLDKPKITDNGESCVITISYESRFVALKRAKERRYTHEDQQIDYPGDMGFQFVTALQDKVLEWK